MFHITIERALVGVGVDFSSLSPVSLRPARSQPHFSDLSATMLARSLFWFATSAATCLAASLQEVTNFGDNPTNIQMYIYVPDQLAANPPVIVAVRYIQTALPPPLLLPFRHVLVAEV